MNNLTLRLFAGFCMLIFFSSCGKEATLNITSSGFGYNAVVSVYPSEHADKAVIIKSLKSNQTFKVKVDKAGYGRLVLSFRGDRSAWIYLDNSVQEITYDTLDRFQYPVKSSTSKQGQEIIEYYRLLDQISSNLKDSLQAANDQMDKSTSENVIEAANNLNKWNDRKDKLRTEVIRAFAKRHPTSFFTLLVIDENGVAGPYGKEYLAIIDNLDPKVKESKKAKELVSEITRTSQLEVGSKMAKISGADPLGKPFDEKILKKVNLFICWLSYDKPSRLNNVRLVSLYEQYRGRDVEFISISYDKYRKWWTTVIKDDKLTWPQYSDLLGAKSPNPGNLSNYKAPYMFMTDQSGKVLSQDLSIRELELEFKTHLKL